MLRPPTTIKGWSATALAVAALAAPAPVAAHTSEYCEHSTVSGTYWQVRYYTYENVYQSERTYNHYHRVGHNQATSAGSGRYVERHVVWHYCGQGTVRNGYFDPTGGVQIEIGTPTDVTGNLPVPNVPPPDRPPIASRTTDAAMLGRQLRERGTQVRYLLVLPSLGTSAAIEAPADGHCAVGLRRYGKRKAAIEVAGREDAARLGHACDGTLVAR